MIDANCQEVNVHADVGFIMDVSRSVGRNWPDEKKFVMDLVNQFDLYPNGAHAAVTIFDHQASLEIKFSDNNTTDEFEAALDSLPFTRGWTEIGVALETALNEMFQEANGMRSDSPQVAVLITDGKSNSAVDYAGFKKRFKAAHIKLLVVGVGNVNKDDLEQLVQTSDDLLLVKDFLKLNVTEFVEKTTFCEPTIETTCHEVNLQSDVGLIMDVSGSVGRKGWSDEKQFAMDLVKTIGLSPSGAHAAVTLFDHQATLDIKFTDYFTNEAFETALDALRFRRGSTEIGLALETALTEMFQEANGMRSVNPKVAILITDGQSKTTVAYEDYKNRFHAANIKLLVVGIGNVNEDDLEQLVQTRDDLLLVTDFLTLNVNDFFHQTTFCN